MNKTKIWISAARLRTLPLSISGVLVGTALANYQDYKDWFIFLLCLLITIGFQVTSNFANDYGDGVKGTDGEDRIGPARALQSGALTAGELKKGIRVTAVISIAFAVLLLAYVFGTEQLPLFLLFLVLGGFSIWAAIRYTVGNNAYGYKGLGDVFVFLFFGLLAVLGTKFLYNQQLTFWDIIPALGIGFLCVGVLNLNNLRDIASDKKHGKNTLIVRIGFRWGKWYHSILIAASFLCFVVYSYFQIEGVWGTIHVVFYLPIGLHLYNVVTTRNPSELDPELKKLALSTFFLSLCFYISLNYFL
ncbi:MAG: 1,4-dihydroxy-2-naphthoate octaprenyltransferase [Bacteroidota bacterium]